MTEITTTTTISSTTVTPDWWEFDGMEFLILRTHQSRFSTGTITNCSFFSLVIYTKTPKFSMPQTSGQFEHRAVERSDNKPDKKSDWNNRKILEPEQNTLQFTLGPR